MRSIGDYFEPTASAQGPSHERVANAEDPAQRLGPDGSALGVRLLYVPNEDRDFRQLGFRRPLENMLAGGHLSGVSVYSLQWRIRRSGNAEAERRGLIRRVEDFQPDVVLMQHLGATGLTDAHFRQLRQAAAFDLIYHEADPYSQFLHPLPRAARAAGRAADVVFTVGKGVFAQNFRRAGARDVRWVPHVFEPDRYAYVPIERGLSREFDIVMIANRNSPRLRGLPDWRRRIAFAEYMQDRFGSRFGLFGAGWTGPSARGPVPFSEQDRAIRAGWISANWDHYAEEPWYFSNRLPISLAAGSIHATCYHPGYESIFPPEAQSFLKFGESFNELADLIEQALDTSPEKRLAAAVSAQEYAYRHMRQDDQLIDMLNWRDLARPVVVRPDRWDLTMAVPDEL